MLFRRLSCRVKHTTLVKQRTYRLIYLSDWVFPRELTSCLIFSTLYLFHCFPPYFSFVSSISIFQSLRAHAADQVPIDGGELVLSRVLAGIYWWFDVRFCWWQRCSGDKQQYSSHRTCDLESTIVVCQGLCLSGVDGCLWSFVGWNFCKL